MKNLGKIKDMQLRPVRDPRGYAKEVSRDIALDRLIRLHASVLKRWHKGVDLLIYAKEEWDNNSKTARVIDIIAEFDAIKVLWIKAKARREYLQVLHREIAKYNLDKARYAAIEVDKSAAEMKFIKFEQENKQFTVNIDL